jgi:hypothetical protein
MPGKNPQIRPYIPQNLFVNLLDFELNNLIYKKIEKGINKKNKTKNDSKKYE